MKQRYVIRYTNLFKKAYKRIKKRGCDLSKLQEVVDMLACGMKLPEQYRDHNLTGNWVKHHECHIEPDWLLIYYKEDDTLVLTLVNTGTHSDLF